MAVNCGIANGIALSCARQREAIGGVKGRVYMGNLEDVSEFVTDADGYVTAITFTDYATQGLHLFSGLKNQQSGSTDAVPTDGGNVSFNHSVQLTLLDVTPQQKQVLEDLAFASVAGGVFAIMETAGDQFLLFGKDFGLVIESAPKSTGLTPQDSTTRVVTLSGGQGSLESVFYTGISYADTKARLDDYVISSQL